MKQEQRDLTVLLTHSTVSFWVFLVTLGIASCQFLWRFRGLAMNAISELKALDFTNVPKHTNDLKVAKCFLSAKPLLALHILD